ncbi:hypothetical protein D3C75_443310 [compost metagenome]
MLPTLEMLRRKPQQQRILQVPHHQESIVIKQRKTVAHGVEGGFQLRAFFFQQFRGVFQRCGVSRKNVKRSRQFAQFITPLQRRHAYIALAPRQPRHRMGNRRQVRAEVAVNIPPGKTRNHQCQQGK